MFVDNGKHIVGAFGQTIDGTFVDSSRRASPSSGLIRRLSCTVPTGALRSEAVAAIQELKSRLSLDRSAARMVQHAIRSVIRRLTCCRCFTTCKTGTVHRSFLP